MAINIVIYNSVAILSWLQFLVGSDKSEWLSIAGYYW